MEIIVHVDAKKLDRDYKAALDEYVKRTSPYCRITLKLYKNFSKLELRKSSAKIIVLPGDTDGMTSPELAQMITDYNLNGCSCIEFIISSGNMSDSEDYRVLNLSSFSLGGELTAVVLTEQLYRAYTILNNITYHK